MRLSVVLHLLGPVITMPCSCSATVLSASLRQEGFRSRSRPYTCCQRGRSGEIAEAMPWWRRFTTGRTTGRTGARQKDFKREGMWQRALLGVRGCQGHV